MTKTISPAKLRELRQKERKRLEECRDADFRKGRVTHSAATDDALSRFLLLDDLLSGSAAAEKEE